MPHQKKNQLTELVKLIPQEIEKFREVYEQAEDKPACIWGIGDLIALRSDNSALFTQLITALKISDEDIDNCELHMLMNHCSGHRNNFTDTQNRIVALTNFVMQWLCDVRFLVFHPFLYIIEELKCKCAKM